jgi:signal transduction histidine kinase
MAARRVIHTSARRAIYAAGLLAAVLGALLGAWFLSGWHDVRARQHQARQAPRLLAERRASDLAHELRDELDALIAREAHRPYFHYHNLVHDPQASPGLNVAPSPLARGSEDKLVLGYFQLDAKGRATTPTINDEVPKLSEPQQLAKNRAFRDHVVRDLIGHLAPPPLVGANTGTLPRSESPSPQPRPEATLLPQQQQTQVIRVDPSVYAQNANPNAVYSQQLRIRSSDAPMPAPAATPASVTIIISPLEWRTLAFAGEPALLAIRQVQTPDGTLAQGFVVDQSTLKNSLAKRAGDMVAHIHHESARGITIVPGWSVTVEPPSPAVAQAADEADAIARAFLVRFVGVGSLAVVAAGCVLLLMVRAEKLARERSQFAAAAAHELRTPLAGLQLYGEMLADGLGDPDKIREYARRMGEDAARMGRVVSNVLGFSQLERGNLGIDAQVGPLDEVLFELADRARPALDRAGATLEVNVPSDLRARFDRDALTRIIGNLLDNAEKYARGAEDRRIRLAALDRGDTVEVSVEDCGPGIKDVTKLFRVFSRGASSSDGPAGLGLGLALSLSLARAMGGELTYRPREGGGAAFVLQLPHG